MEQRKVFDEKGAYFLKETLKSRLHRTQKDMAEQLVDCIARHRHGRIFAFEVSELESNVLAINWATVRKKKLFDIVWNNVSYGCNYPLPLPMRFEIIVPGKSDWKKIRERIFSAVAPEILERHKRMKLKHLINSYGLDLRLREGKDQWGEPLSIDGTKLKNYVERLKAISVEQSGLYYLVTRVGTFGTGLLRIDVRSALEFIFGLTGRHVRSAESLVKEIERQLELREQAKKIFPSGIPRGRIAEVDPTYGVIIGNVFYPAGKYPHGIRLPAGLRSIRKFLFALYGREIPECPDILHDVDVPPWTIRRFGESMRAYLLDEEPERDLFVFVRGKRLYLGHGKKTFDVTGRVEKTDVAAAFRAAFGVELPPQATREDVEAIVAMTMLR